MNKYLIAILLSFTSYVQAQDYHPLNTIEQPQSDHHAFSSPAQSSPSDEDKKSTPSKDAAAATQEKSDKQEVEKPAEDKKEKSEKKEKEKPKSPHTFTGNVSLVSDYRFRGISQTMRQPAIQGGFDYSHANGIYLGTWASNVDGTTHLYNNTSMEWDFYGGYKGKLLPCSIPEFSYNIGLIYYYYPGGQTHTPERVRYNTGEFYIEFTYKWLSVKYWQSLTNYFGICSDNPPFNWEKNHFDRPNGNSRGSTYIEVNLSFDLYKKMEWCGLKVGKLNLLLHLAHLTVRHYEHLSYTDWRATLTQEFDWFNLFISYVGTNAKHAYFDVLDNAFHPKKRHLGVQGVVVGVTRTF